MILRVLLPERVMIEEEVAKVRAEAENGAFTLMPRHVDFTAAIVPGIFSYVPRSDARSEQFLAVDRGVLVKCGDEVLLSIHQAATGPDLDDLKRTVVSEYEELDERERRARSATARIEADLVRRFLELDLHET